MMNPCHVTGVHRDGQDREGGGIAEQFNFASGAVYPTKLKNQTSAEAEAAGHGCPVMLGGSDLSARAALELHHECKAVTWGGIRQEQVVGGPGL